MEENEALEVTEPINYSFTFEESSIYPYEGLDYLSYENAVQKHSLDLNSMYKINVQSGDSPDPIFTICVPNDRVMDIVVVDGMIYNFGDSPLRVAGMPYNDPNTYYFVLDIPVYGSEEYYKSLSDVHIGDLNEYAIPFDVYRASYADGEIQLSECVIYNPSFIYSSSPMAAWPVDTIFLFIILIILVCKSVFRKG